MLCTSFGGATPYPASFRPAACSCKLSRLTKWKPLDVAPYYVRCPRSFGDRLHQRKKLNLFVCCVNSIISINSKCFCSDIQSLLGKEYLSPNFSLLYYFYCLPVFHFLFDAFDLHRHKICHNSTAIALKGRICPLPHKST